MRTAGSISVSPSKRYASTNSTPRIISVIVEAGETAALQRTHLPLANAHENIGTNARGGKGALQVSQCERPLTHGAPLARRARRKPMKPAAVAPRTKKTTENKGEFSRLLRPQRFERLSQLPDRCCRRTSISWCRSSTGQISHRRPAHRSNRHLPSLHCLLRSPCWRYRS